MERKVKSNLAYLLEEFEHARTAHLAARKTLIDAEAALEHARQKFRDALTVQFADDSPGEHTDDDSQC